MVGGRGKEKTATSLSIVEIFDPFLEVWEQPQHTNGELPPGLYGAGCTSVCNNISGQRKFYMYGGFDDESWSSQLHCLDIATFHWDEVKIWSLPAHGRSLPMPKAGCGLATLCGTRLACFGGYGVPQGKSQQGSEFIPDSGYSNERGWTNEFHLFECNGRIVGQIKPFKGVFMPWMN